MIYDTIDHAGLYRPISANLAKALDFLTSTDLSKYDTERVEIDGDKVYALFQRYETKPVNDSPEAHKKYIDVQYIVSGIEKIRWAKLGDLTQVEERYSKGQDIAFYTGDSRFDFVLTKGTFLMLYPQDAHMPGISDEKDVNVRKIVFKIAANG